MIASPELVAAFKASLDNDAHGWAVVAVIDDVAGAGGVGFTTGTVCLYAKPLALQATVVIGATDTVMIYGSPVAFDDLALAAQVIALAAAFQSAAQDSAIAKLTA